VSNWQGGCQGSLALPLSLNAYHLSFLNLPNLIG
jgi:hypothetical protein